MFNVMLTQEEMEFERYMQGAPLPEDAEQALKFMIWAYQIQQCWESCIEADINYL